MIDGMQEGPCPLYQNVKQATNTPKFSKGTSTRE